VNDNEKEYADHVLEECAKKVCKDMSSNLRIQATNAYGRLTVLWSIILRTTQLLS
jgi:hypothetical protein